MDADLADGRTTPMPTRSRWFALAGITLAALALALAALDDITTDNATHFRAEYTILVGCATWLMFVAGQLWRSGSRLNSALTVASVAAAAFMAVDGIGHKRDGGWAVFWPQYLPLTWAWIHGIVVGILMIRRGMLAPAKQLRE